MGFGSKLKKALGKVVGKDPVAQHVMKVDPLAKQFGKDHGLIAKGGPAGAAAVGGGREEFVPPVRNGGWQADRVAALRAKFGRPGATPQAAVSPGTAVSQQPAVAQPTPGVGTKAIGVRSIKPAPPPKPTTQANPVMSDIAEYQQAWQQNQP